MSARTSEAEHRGPARKVVVIDDELQIRRFLRISLTSQGYVVAEAATGSDGICVVAREQPDLVVLDLGLPDMEGSHVLTEIRGWSAVPVIVLSVRNDEGEKVSALDQGANDYVTKPFGINEFLARVRNLLRVTPGRTESPVVHCGNVAIDLAMRLVSCDNEPIHLTPKEYRVMQMLAQQPDRVVTQGTLLREIWGPTHVRDTHYLRIVIARLRQKLGDNPDDPAIIQTEAGVGYRLSSDSGS